MSGVLSGVGSGVAPRTTDAPHVPDADMVWIPSGECLSGSDNHEANERPARRQMVSGFWIDRVPVTNARFAQFVQATGYVTVDAGLGKDSTTLSGTVLTNVRVRSSEKLTLIPFTDVFSS